MMFTPQSSRRPEHSAGPRPTHMVPCAIGSGECGVVTGIANIERSIRILDSLAHALESRRLTMHAGGRSLQVTLGNDQVSFSLTGITEIDPHVPTLRGLDGAEFGRTEGTLNPVADIW